MEILGSPGSASGLVFFLSFHFTRTRNFRYYRDKGGRFAAGIGDRLERDHPPGSIARMRRVQNVSEVGSSVDR